MPDIEDASNLRPQKRLLSFMFSRNVPPLPAEEERKIHPESSANIISRIMFWWILPVMLPGYKRTLEPPDLFVLSDDIKVNTMTQSFYKYLNEAYSKAEDKHINNKRKERNDTSERTKESDEKDLEDFKLSHWLTLGALLRTFKWQYLFACFLLSCSNVCTTLNPLLTKALINYVERRSYGFESNVGRGVGYAIGTTALIFTGGVCINHFFYRSMLTGAQVKAVLTKALLDKSFRLSAKSKHDYPVSKITSMMGTDVSRIDFALGFQPFLICFPIPIGISIAILVVNIGVSSLVGLAVMAVFMVCIAVSTKKLFGYRFKANVFTDVRVNYIKEVLNNLKVIKFYSWEPPYGKMIGDARQKESSILYKMNVLRNIVTAFAMTLALISSMVAFLVLYSLRNSSGRSAANIFSSLSLFNSLTQQVFLIPLALSSGSDAFIGLMRISNYLYSEETKLENTSIEATGEIKQIMEKSNLSIKVQNASFSWQSFEDEVDEVSGNTVSRVKESRLDKEKRTLKEKSEDKEDKEDKSYTSGDATTLEDTSFAGLNDINLEVKKGEFIVVTGYIGTGKSSLLNALAGFMNRDSGQTYANGELLLCGLPWVQNETFKENVLFGKPYDEARYNEVIYACSLESDLAILPAGENTEIGERGITLSGGQKARINLARSVYANADIILLDDVLSAVDARVGKHIMQNCILGLLKDKTRILATHQLSLIGDADRIIFLNGDGSIDVGTAEELDKRNESFRKLMAFSSQAEKDDDEEKEIEQQNELYEDNEKMEEEKEAIEIQVPKNKAVIDEEAVHKDYKTNKDREGALFAKEGAAVNSISFTVYKNYVVLGSGRIGLPIIPMILITAACATFCQLFSNTWLSFWISVKFKGRTDGFYIGLYIMFVFLTVIFLICQFILLGYLSNRASRRMNIMAINRLLRAPMAFMDTTPMGRILNRFTKDTDVLDNEISDQIRLFSFTLCNIIGVIILCIIYLPWFAIAVPFLIILFVSISNFYQASAREIKRLEATQRSFVYNNFNEILSGMNTIKAYKAGERFLAKNDKFIDRMNEAYYLTIASQRWLGIHLDIVACAFALLIALLCVNRVFKINSASVGLLLSYVLSIVNQLSMLIRTYTQLENEMNSVERLSDYAFNLPEEAAYTISETTPEPNWPQNGSISFKDVQLAYRPGLPLVLKNISFDVKPAEKVGICGRTGAGKSSIMTALYRLSELSGGSIEIDGIDIATLGLHDVRSKLSIIPQDPVLFQGTIRKNLDPFGESPDIKLWEALRKCGLIGNDKIEQVMNQTKNSENLHKFHLDQNVEDDGTNFSLGEKQLIAFARALVRESKILILDEATSSVDYETDSKIQSTIINEFSHCTILCIAHRLKTIINYDKIIVLDKGKLEEFDTPWNLFNTPGSIFQQMCERSNIHAEDFSHQKE